MSRFASVTADLLARKGEAKPWGEPAKKPLTWEPAQLAPPPLVEPPPAPHMRKCTMRISQHDYQRLGLLAVKQGKTRQRLLQEAVDRLFTGMTAEFGAGCNCLRAAKCD